jgi:hypothetical protein
MADLASFVESKTDTDNGLDLENAGPMSVRLASVLGNGEKARALIATAFWECFIHSPALFRTAQQLFVGISELLMSEKIVVYRPNCNRFDLLCFAPSYEYKDGTSVRVDPTPDELLQGWNTLYSGQRLDNWNLVARGPMLAVEALGQGSPFAIVAIAPPPTQPTKPPDPCCEVVAGSASSTVGIVAKDKSGRQGVTAAYHAVGSATTAKVDGKVGTKVSEHIISDSCFLEMNSLPATGTRGSKGPMKTILPRGNQLAEFDGHTSKLTDATITGWSLELPNTTLRNQSRVYTTKVTDPGDSGSALITKDDDYIVGFAFERSAYGSPIDFSSWIWADLVFQGLDLEYPP